jgi:hypothetical protein
MNIIETKQKELTHHQVYQSFNSIEAIQHFMRYHVFAVWDFMSLLKSLQNHITCTQVPWKPSVYPAEMVRLVNQIVVGEESDLDQYGNAISHFDLYIKAMEEVGASTVEIKSFLKGLDLNDIPVGAREFVSHNLQVAKFGHVVEVAASFFYGREKLIPDMFQTIVDTLKKENVEAPTLIYYLQRHIEVDGNEHGPLALKCLDYLTAGDLQLESLALHSGKDALQKRQELWDFVLSRLSK